MKNNTNLKPYIIAAIISIIIGVGFTLLMFFGFKRPLIDGTGYSSIILIAAGLLIIIAREGFFDIFSYGFRQLGSQLFSKKANEFNDYPHYKEAINEVRKRKSKYYLSLIVVGVIFLLVTIVVSICTRH